MRVDIEAGAIRVPVSIVFKRDEPHEKGCNLR